MRIVNRLQGYQGWKFRRNKGQCAQISSSFCLWIWLKNLGLILEAVCNQEAYCGWPYWAHLLTKDEGQEENINTSNDLGIHAPMLHYVSMEESHFCHPTQLCWLLNAVVNIASHGIKNVALVHSHTQCQYCWQMNLVFWAICDVEVQALMVFLGWLHRNMALLDWPRSPAAQPCTRGGWGWQWGLGMGRCRLLRSLLKGNGQQQHSIPHKQVPKLRVWAWSCSCTWSLGLGLWGGKPALSLVVFFFLTFCTGCW
jgi:hypothetical protein